MIWRSTWRTWVSWTWLPKRKTCVCACRRRSRRQCKTWLLFRHRWLTLIPAKWQQTPILHSVSTGMCLMDTKLSVTQLAKTATWTAFYVWRQETWCGEGSRQEWSIGTLSKTEPTTPSQQPSVTFVFQAVSTSSLNTTSLSFSVLSLLIRMEITFMAHASYLMKSYLSQWRKRWK